MFIFIRLVSKSLTCTVPWQNHPAFRTACIPAQNQSVAGRAEKIPPTGGRFHLPQAIRDTGTISHRFMAFRALCLSRQDDGATFGTKGTDHGLMMLNFPIMGRRTQRKWKECHAPKAARKKTTGLTTPAKNPKIAQRFVSIKPGRTDAKILTRTGRTICGMSITSRTNSPWLA